MITIKDFMDAYLLAKVKVEQQNQQMQARWVEPIAVGLQAVLAKQLGGRDAIDNQSTKQS